MLRRWWRGITVAWAERILNRRLEWARAEAHAARWLIFTARVELARERGEPLPEEHDVAMDLMHATCVDIDHEGLRGQIEALVDEHRLEPEEAGNGIH